ncbi:Pro-kumamolisin, activation domain [Dyella sp. OK004]|uniref:S53 family peptidase n=1 Tax=Dyella sp. OK004 TaxID=1855292 RepID=UPI0008E64035|nr:S53 family peptidase [Dyella sp. OK004]SFR88315.1 Pro-kumamolisin, activation domain [Dyella sp. OK004]
MLAKLHQKVLAASLTLLFSTVTTVSLAADVKPALDMGATNNAQKVNVTLVLKLHNQDQLEDYVQQTVTPGSAHYRQFLTTSQFASQYGATDAEIAQVQSFLQKQGLAAGTLLPNHMAIQTSGTLAQFSAAFQAPIHTFVSRENGRSFHRPTQPLVLPSSLANVLLHATGLNNEHQLLSHRISAPSDVRQQASLQTLAKTATSAKAATPSSGNPTATGVPGSYTVGDVANFYNINPLYARGVTGKGSTIAIVTLSNFYPSDAETYWSGIGLVTKPNRITQIHVDGGGAFDGGSGETALDVEQSGGLAPDADILVYDAPNAGNSFTNAAMQAVSDNKADTISTSWGLPEIFNFAALNVTGAKNTDTTDVGDLKIWHQILLEAAVQGQSFFAATGDSGAYDTVRGLGVGTTPGTYNAPLTVDSPASDPFMTAAGGTTVPFSYHFRKGPVQSITQESVWSWDYIQNYFDTYVGKGVIDLFSTGGGGGVSVYWKRPFYQLFTQGVRTSEKNQTLTFNDTTGPQVLLKLPGNFHGRNIPDISLNADPETGYIVVSTTDGGAFSGEGGTSFVAPQLNGISALLTQSSGHRVGFWNPQVYLLQNIFGYGKWSSFNDIRAGDNWFYFGKPGYEPGSGIGTLNVSNFDLFLRSF